jgi:2-phospho-L-lactate guanylyltransferase (CobY/MobA/RfbA family)
MTTALCSRCKMSPRRARGQSWCAPCSAEYKRRRRQTKGGEQVDAGNGEQRPAGNGGGEGKPDSEAVSAFAKRKARLGPPVPADWREKFLISYRKTGTRWVSAREAKVSHDTVSRAEAADPVFAAQVEDARQEYADALEQNLDRLARKKDNVIAGIVLAKKHRPNDFIERRQELHVHAHANLSAEEGRHLIAAMLAHVTATTREVLVQPATEGHKVLEAGRLEDPPLAEGPTS